MAPSAGVRGQGAAQGCRRAGCTRSGGGLPHTPSRELVPLLPLSAGGGPGGGGPFCPRGGLFWGLGCVLLGRALASPVSPPATAKLVERKAAGGTAAVPSPPGMSASFGADRTPWAAQPPPGPLSSPLRRERRLGQGQMQASRRKPSLPATAPGLKSQAAQPSGRDQGSGTPGIRDHGLGQRDLGKTVGQRACGGSG